MKLLKRAGSKQMLTQARGWGGGGRGWVRYGDIEVIIGLYVDVTSYLLTINPEKHYSTERSRGQS